ncbi:Peptidyl-prolyl isomerase CWC27 [Psilocybe cubensis]|uniref:PPIase cyclophilin-type domain-containing protein n=2 Tax=Psilocybe cubensis TaxID=181762 RepID=A0A8H7XW52_PSICU|nr:Peptidyl-prolyl isomerase CWC27 [Psilocybe cubensis]KAH9479823.1 Peptidyl-prolyl isomerase CWC27 [Psilocybe cubensis]
MALPTKGRVIVDTTVGEIEIELWSKETPKACRNFLALAMEGYYDGVIFHRVVPGFLVQTGDKTGTGAGGESFYGEPFEDEIHPRLRFSHRGLVAMANNGTKNSNDSQFFITLDRADELHGKHTLFGRCMGDTVYNVMKIGEMELDSEGRPVYPPRIKSIRIVDNPFDDIVPRITAAEKRAQQRAREQAQKEREEEQRRKGAKKNVKLLSFGAEEDAGEGDDSTTFKKKPMYRPELVEKPRKETTIPDFVSQPSSSSKAKPPALEPPKESKSDKPSKKTTDDDISKIRQQHAKEKSASENARKTEIEKMEAEIRKLQKRKDGGGSDSDDDASRNKKAKKSYLSEELAKYAKGRGIHKKGKKRDEGDVLAALNSFRGKLQNTMFVDDEVPNDEGKGKAREVEGGTNNEEEGAVAEGGVVGGGGEEDEGMEVDYDFGFMGHALHFAKDNMEETVKAERDYEVIDPRQRSAQARQEERERRKAALKAKGGGVSGGRYRR